MLAVTRSRWKGAFAVALLACLALLGVAASLARSGDVALVDLLRDTTATLGAPFYIGLVSNVGLLLWGAATTICLFTASVASRTGCPAADARHFLAGAAVSAWLLLDDALLLHEQVFPEHLGLAGGWSLIVGSGAMAFFLIGSHRVIRAGDYPVLLAALMLLGASVTMDQLHDMQLLGPLILHSDDLETVLEDTLKLLGIAMWLIYFTLCAHDLLVTRESGPSPRP